MQIIQIYTAISLAIGSSIVTAQPQYEVGHVTIDGSNRAIFSEEKNGVPSKYFLDKDGKKVDWALYQQKNWTQVRDKYGAFGKRLDDKISGMQLDETVDVIINFARKPKNGSLPSGKLKESEAAAQTEESFFNGVSEIESKVGKLMPTKTGFHGRNNLDVVLKKSDLLGLRFNPNIESVDLPLDPKDEKVKRLASLQYSFVGGSGSYGALNYPSDCGNSGGNTQQCGSNVRVGILEPNPIWNSDSSAHLNGSWFVKRPGTPTAARHPHGLWTSAMIRNTGPGAGIWWFDNGGSYQASLVALGYPVTPVGTMQDAYDWLVLNQSVSVVNNSWEYLRYLGGGTDAAANTMEQHMDIDAAEYPYVLNVMAAGNSGQIGDMSENQACVDSSAVYNPPGWTAQQCQRVGWWNHNSLIVGSVDNNTTRSAYSSFKDGDHDNEAPHVVVRGSGVELPWMQPYNAPLLCPGDTGVANTTGQLCGTSIASPTIVAFASNLISLNSSLGGYPEVLKGIIMASATTRPIGGVRWPTSSSSDIECGVGIPYQPDAKTIATNEKSGSKYSSGPYGFKRFSIPTTVDNYMLYDTITVTSSQTGYVHFYLTWVSSPANQPVGIRYDPDDLDLLVQAPGITAKVSQSVRNTTEYVAQPITANVARTFSVRSNLYNRLLDRTKPIYCSLVWTFDTKP